MDSSISSHLLVLFAGIFAGFINVVAGGGSLLTVPVLIFIGLPPVMANGTNRIALLAQNAVAIHRFRRKGYFPLRAGIILGAAASLGAVLGSQIAVSISDDLFRKILSGVMILVLFIILLGKHKGGQEGGELPQGKLPLLALIFFFIGIYGGFIQAGTGFLIIAGLSVVGGMGLVSANAVKVMVVFFYTIPALVVFLVNGQIAWSAGLVLALGNMTGALFGAKLSVAGGERWIKIVLTIAVSAMAVRLFFF